MALSTGQLLSGLGVASLLFCAGGLECGNQILPPAVAAGGGGHTPQNGGGGVDTPDLSGRSALRSEEGAYPPHPQAPDPRAVATSPQA